MAAQPDRYPFEQTLSYFEEIVRQAQRTIQAQIEAALRSGDLETASRRRMQLAAVDSTLQQLGAAVGPLSSQLVREAWEQGAARALAQIEALPVTAPATPGTFHGISTEAVRAMQDSLSHRLDDARQTLGRRVEDVYAREQRRAALRSILGAEGSPQEASQHLQRALKDKAVKDGQAGFVDSAGRRWSLDTYSNMAVRTVTREAVVQGAVARMASHGIVLARVSTHPDSCPLCEPFQGTLVSLDGSVSEWKGEAVSDTGQMPPYHPNAVMEGTLVEPVGRPMAGTRARWNGPLTHVQTLSGISLAVGPNHPVLTARGWVAAKLLREGDKVVRRVDGDRDGRRAIANQHVEHGPAFAEQMFDALLAVGRTMRAAISPTDLHGDGRFCEGEIDVVHTDRALARMRDAEIVEQLRELVLVDARMQLPSLVGVGSHLALGDGVPPATRSIVRGRHVARVHAPGAHLHAARSQFTADDRLVDAVTSGEHHYGLTGDILSDDLLAHDHSALSVGRSERGAARLHAAKHRFRADAEGLRELGRGLSGDVALDDVVHVRQLDAFHGMAFDFGMESGMYFADGLLVSNCAHSLEPVSVTIQSLRDELELEPEGVG